MSYEIVQPPLSSWRRRPASSAKMFPTFSSSTPSNTVATLVLNADASSSPNSAALMPDIVIEELTVTVSLAVGAKVVGAKVVGAKVVGVKVVGAEAGAQAPPLPAAGRP